MVTFPQYGSSEGMDILLSSPPSIDGEYPKRLMAIGNALGKVGCGLSGGFPNDWIPILEAIAQAIAENQKIKNAPSKFYGILEVGIQDGLPVIRGHFNKRQPLDEEGLTNWLKELETLARELTSSSKEES